MLYTEFTVGNETYKLRLNTRDIVALEKKLGCNPLGIFGGGKTLPSITQMVDILHASLQQYQHGVNIDKAYDIYDAWLADGHTMPEFLAVLVDIYKVSGIIPDEVDEKN